MKAGAAVRRNDTKRSARRTERVRRRGGVLGPDGSVPVGCTDDPIARAVERRLKDSAHPACGLDAARAHSACPVPRAHSARPARYLA